MIQWVQANIGTATSQFKSRGNKKVDLVFTRDTLLYNYYVQITIEVDEKGKQ